MFKAKMYVKLVAFAVLLVLVTIPVMSMAKVEELKNLPSKKDIAVNGVLTVPMEKAIKLSSLINNVYVLDSSSKKVPTSTKLSTDGKSIIVMPTKPYNNGAAYSLIIRKNVQYLDGKTLAKGLRLRFTTLRGAEKLPVVGSSANLRKLLSQFAEQMGYVQNGGVRTTGLDLNVRFSTSKESKSATSAPAAEARAADSGSLAASGDYSQTNVQVQGVDEADIVKTDGKFLYYVGNQKIVIAKAAPADKMEITSIIKFYSQITPLEIYVDDKHLTVIGTAYTEIPIHEPVPKIGSGTLGINVIRYKPYYANPTVKMLVYDISDKSDIKQLREVELEGNYLSSRKIGSKIYLISNKYMNYFFWNQEMDYNETPSFRDSASGEGFRTIPYDKISYFPDSVEPNYMLVAGVDLDKPKESAHVSTYLGSGQSVYASTENLYVAVTKYKKDKTESSAQNKLVEPSLLPIRPGQVQQETVVYKFGLKNGRIDYLTKGEVPGRVLNQFSMDESNKTFRIATTKGDLWGTEENLSKNNLYILDASMKRLGQIEGIAPGEQIYSVRFMGDRAYMVTFRTVDPLFVIDLKDARNPKILGQLKIPGYSDYLHPYDENHIIGFGKDAVEVIHKDNHGQEVWRNAYNLGMKLAVFDVTDVTNPIEKFSERLGDRGTESELLRNHKALLFSKEKNLLAFPVTVMEVKDKNARTYDNAPPYGTFAFQGAYIYNIDMEKGFKLRGKITHIHEEEYKRAGSYWYDPSKFVDRILYIKDDLYTFSKYGIKANDIKTLKEKGFVKIP